MPADNEQNYNSVQQYQWSGLKQMLTNLARFSVPVLPIQFITAIVLLFVVYSGTATGWGASLTFTEGLTPHSTLWWIWKAAGFLFGYGLASWILIDIIYKNMSNIKLSGEDYADKDGKYERAGYSWFNLLARATTIIYCAMFIYAQNSSAERAELTVANTKEAKIKSHQSVIAYNDSVYQSQVVYYRNCDYDGDPSNDDSARVWLRAIERERKKERIKEDSIYQQLLSLPDRPNENTVLASSTVMDGNRLLYDLGAEEKPANWKFKVSLIILSIIIGFCTEGVIARGGKMIGRYRAFHNVKKVHDEVNKLMSQNEEITETYDKKPSKFSLFRREFSSVNGGHSSPANGGGGEGFDWNSERIREMLDYIKKNWRGYGGTKTQEQIGAEFQCGKSYISQLITAAKDKKLLIDPGSIRNGR